MQSLNYGLTQQQRAGLVFHSFIIVLLGLFGGFGWLVALADFLQIWPIPPIDISIPETKELWRNAHTGPITNALLALAIAGIAPLLSLNERNSSILYYSVIIMIWFNTIGYQTSPYTSNRGLAPSGSFLNHLCYFSFYIAVFAVFTAVILGIYGSYKTLKSLKSNTKITND